jgi:hypothetical protein
VRQLAVLLTLISFPLFATAEESASTEATVNGDGVSVSGYVRARYGMVLEGEEGPGFVGINDGFFLDNARLIVSAKKGAVDAVVSIDGAVDRRAAANTATGQVDVGLKDAWVGYTVADYLKIQAGQFKPPFDAEELQSTKAMFFIERAVDSRGVRGVEGYNVDGLSLPRQAGALVSGDLGLGAGVALGYGLSVTNGSGANHPTNDNDELAYTGRLTLSHDTHLSVGAGVHYNRITNGAVPDLLSDDELAWVVDFSYRRQLGPIGFFLAAQYLVRDTTSVDVEAEPKRSANGYHGAFGLMLPAGFSLGYRYAHLDPTAQFEAEDPVVEAVLDTDAITHHTVGLGYDVDGTPLGIKVNYTLAQEDEGRALDNDRVDILMQASF